LRYTRLFTELIALTGAAESFWAEAAERPNLVIILADDSGFSDVGCYGGEIQTPHLDRLAAGGIRFTQLYNTARCCPTRAALLTGLYPHQAGVGHMVEDLGARSYRGFLHDQTVTLAAGTRTRSSGSTKAIGPCARGGGV
jgi:arylsulfatase